MKNRSNLEATQVYKDITSISSNRKISLLNSYKEYGAGVGYSAKTIERYYYEGKEIISMQNDPQLPHEGQNEAENPSKSEDLTEKQLQNVPRPAAEEQNETKSKNQLNIDDEDLYMGVTNVINEGYNPKAACRVFAMRNNLPISKTTNRYFVVNSAKKTKLHEIKVEQRVKDKEEKAKLEMNKQTKQFAVMAHQIIQKGQTTKVDTMPFFKALNDLLTVTEENVKDNAYTYQLQQKIAYLENMDKASTDTIKSLQEQLAFEKDKNKMLLKKAPMDKTSVERIEELEKALAEEKSKTETLTEQLKAEQGKNKKQDRRQSDIAKKQAEYQSKLASKKKVAK